MPDSGSLEERACLILGCDSVGSTGDTAIASYVPETAIEAGGPGDKAAEITYEI